MPADTTTPAETPPAPNSDIAVVTSFPRKVREIENVWIAMSDGVKLAARMWLPEDAEAKPVPAILEYLPYRKRDGTVVRDALTHPYFAGHGYAAIRVDMRGNGDSEGLLYDEYTKQEQDDALEVIAWIARQSWCTGKLGMMGISWGGFNALQVAARGPAALKAIVTLCSTDDRYEDDIHYKGGCPINENLGWASTMFAYSSRPPDPAIVGARWRDMWLRRLENQPMLILEWLKHPHRDDYWKHGSVCENFGGIEAAVLCVGGWHDAYSNAVPRLMRGLRGPCKAIVGPWAHKYPHFAVPGPRIGFLQEALRWWDAWLKGEATGIFREPPFRVYVMDADRPGTAKTHIGGRWIGDQIWNAGHVKIKHWYLNAGGIGGAPDAEAPLTVSSPQTTGMDGGEYCIIWLGPEFPGDQRADDAGSLVFDSPPLAQAIDIVGQPAVELAFSADKPVASIAVRLNHVWPDGAVSRITYHLQNLCMRDSSERPAPLEPGRRYRLRIKLDDIAMRVPAGHKLRVAISTCYWPMMWPSPEAVTLTVHAGASSLHLPVREAPAGETAPVFAPPESAEPLRLIEHEKPLHTRERGRDDGTAETRLDIVDDFGRHEIVAHGLITHGRGRESYTIKDGDPLSARMETHWTEELARGDWRVRTETRSRLTATATHWVVWGKLEAFEGEAKVFAREWNEEIARRLN